jgi:xanthine dehydrogenase FAD-binding subunit
MVMSLHPTSLKDALEARASGNVIPYAGGTDLMIRADENAAYLFLDRVAEMKNIAADGDAVRIGAACTFTEILESGLTPAILKEAVGQIGAPAIRNLGTPGGNICNGSAKADSALAFYVTDSKLRLMSARGERVLPISEFYQGGKKTALLPDELLVEIIANKAGTENYYYKKVGARNALAISRVSFAALFGVKGGRITTFRTAFGAIGDVIFRRPELDDMMLGKTPGEASSLKAAYLEAYDKAIAPIKGRVSAEYRKTVCMNLLRDFLEQNGI